jgi:hypothetical protein
MMHGLLDEDYAAELLRFPIIASGMGGGSGANQRIFEEGRQPQARGRAVFHALQLLPRETVRVTPAMGAGLAHRVRTIDELVELPGA